MTGEVPHRGDAPATITDGLARAARIAPHAAAVYLPEGPGGRGAAGWRAVTNRQLWARSRAVAHGVRRAGLSPHDRAVVLVPPSIEFFALAFGLLDAGVVPVLVDPGIGRRHLQGCLAEADATAFFGNTRAHAARLALRLAPGADLHVIAGAPPVLRRVGGRSGRTPFGVALEHLERLGGAPDLEPARPVGPDATAAIVFTSGSTGPPKGVSYRHGNLLGQVAALARLYDLGPDDVQLATFPPFALFGPMLGMGTVVPRMDFTRPAAVHPPDIAEAVAAFGATVVFGSPALLDTVGRWADGGGPARRRVFAGVRLVMSAGAPVARRIVDTVSDLLDEDARLVTPYGATEALPVASIDHRELRGGARPGDGDARPARTPIPAGPEPPAAVRGVCVGRPAPDVDVAVMRITDEVLEQLGPGDLLPPGELGEIVVAGPVVTDGYFSRPAATRAAKVEWDGRRAHRMGDLGVFDGSGRLWFAGRKAHLVTTSDGPVATVPVERAFDAHPWVGRSALLGIGAPGSQRPCLAVELAPGAPARDVVRPALRKVAAASPHTRVVQDIRIHPGFPVDIRHNAKIDYAALAAWWLGS